MLVQAGKKEDLMVTDNTGLTPAQLASDKNHRQVAFFLVGFLKPTCFNLLVITFGWKFDIPLFNFSLVVLGTGLAGLFGKHMFIEFVE